MNTSQDIKHFQLVLYNDDVNTFDHVINCLISVCNHDAMQAEQCAYLVHHKGKCIIKKGIYADLNPICEALQEQKLSVIIS